MSGIKDQHELNELRQRLYSRGTDTPELSRHGLTDETFDIARGWEEKPKPEPTPAPLAPDFSRLNQKRPYRKFVLLGSLVVLILVIAFSGLYLFLGGNKISGENINFNLSGPSTIGGSEVMNFQVGITNQNDVGIESGVLVLKYPSGTRTASEPVKNIYEERISIGTLGAGEVKNLPVQIGIYGKENEEKQIEATFEYRIANSDGTFFKVAEPLSFRIVSSPIILKVSSIGKVSAGQPVEVILTAKSNSPEPLKNVLITASYPDGFSYKESEPAPMYNENTWKIDELKPEEAVKIKVKGMVVGLTEEKFVIRFNAGLAQTDNPYIVGSELADAQTEFVIENPFISVDISINSDIDRSVILEQGESTGIEVEIKNTLDETVYDMAVEVVPKGTDLQPEFIDSNNGYYDSNKNLVRWEVANNANLSQVLPGDTRTFKLSISPTENRTTSAFSVTVNVYARRVSEQNAQEKLIGTVTAEAKYSSSVALESQVTHMTGPMPPQVGQSTSYLITLVATAGGNDLANTVVNTSLPTYVEWKNDFSGPGSIDYNPVSKQLVWWPGDIKANTKREMVFSVSVLPSVSQVGITPMLVNQQSLRAIDRFTNTTLTADADQLYAELSPEAGYQPGNGVVTQ